MDSRTTQMSPMRRSWSSRRKAVLTAAAGAFSQPMVSCALGAAHAPAPLKLPLSWTGTWQASRLLLSVSGDVRQAENVWRCLGGSGDFTEKRVEEFTTRFIQLESPQSGSAIDWRFDVSHRSGVPEKSIIWDGNCALSYERADIRVVWRELYPPGAAFGATELLSVREVCGRVSRTSTVRLSRSYRITDAGIIEAREIIKTYPAGGTASADAADAARDDVDSTSSTRSALTLRPLSRPLSDAVRREFAYPDGWRGVAAGG